MDKTDFKDSSWPTREDGSNKTMGEMTPEQRREQFRLAVERAKRSFERPEVQARMAAALAKGDQS